MMHAILIGGCLFLGQATTAEQQDLAGQVRQLVRQLDDDALQRRDLAERRLIELGSGVLEVLPEAQAGWPPEVKERLTRVRQALETRLAKDFVRGSRVTLRGQMTLAEALGALEQQTGNRVVEPAGPSDVLTLDIADWPYLRALDHVLDEAGFSINPYGGQAGALTLGPRLDGQMARSARGCYRGLFRFEATRLEAVRDLRSPQLDSLRLRVEVMWEPRAKPIWLVQPLQRIEAVDEAGRALRVDGNLGDRSVEVQPDISTVEIDLPFQLADWKAARIARVRATMLVLIPGRVETFEFDNLPQADNRQQRKAGVTVTVEQLRPNRALHEVRMRVRFDDAAHALESHRGWIYRNEAYLVDGQGQRLEPASYQTMRQTANEIGIGYLFSLDQDPKSYRFVYRTPALISRFPVEYELNNIEQP